MLAEEKARSNPAVAPEGRHFVLAPRSAAQATPMAASTLDSAYARGYVHVQGGPPAASSAAERVREEDDESGEEEVIDLELFLYLIHTQLLNLYNYKDEHMKIFV